MLAYIHILARFVPWYLLMSSQRLDGSLRRGATRDDTGRGRPPAGHGHRTSWAPPVMASEATPSTLGLVAGANVFHHLEDEFVLVEGLLRDVDLDHPARLPVSVSDCFCQLP